MTPRETWDAVCRMVSRQTSCATAPGLEPEASLPPGPARFLWTVRELIQLNAEQQRRFRSIRPDLPSVPTGAWAFEHATVRVFAGCQVGHSAALRRMVTDFDGDVGFLAPSSNMLREPVPHARLVLGLGSNPWRLQDRFRGLQLRALLVDLNGASFEKYREFLYSDVVLTCFAGVDPFHIVILG